MSFEPSIRDEQAGLGETTGHIYNAAVDGKTVGNLGFRVQQGRPRWAGFRRAPIAVRSGPVCPPRGPTV